MESSQLFVPKKRSSTSLLSFKEVCTVLKSGEGMSHYLDLNHPQTKTVAH